MTAAGSPAVVLLQESLPLIHEDRGFPAAQELAGCCVVGRSWGIGSLFLNRTMIAKWHLWRTTLPGTTAPEHFYSS